MLARKGFNDSRIWEMQKDRLIASILVQPHLKKGARIKPEDLFSLPGDKNFKARLMDNKEARNLLAELKRKEVQAKRSGRATKDTDNSRRNRPTKGQ